MMSPTCHDTNFYRFKRKMFVPVLKKAESEGFMKIAEKYLQNLELLHKSRVNKSFFNYEKNSVENFVKAPH